MFSLLRPYIFSLDPEAAHDLAIKSLKLNLTPNLMDDVKDDPITIHNSLSRDIFKEPILINIHTNRMYWHAGAGKDSQKNKSFDRHGQQLNKLGSIALDYDNKIRKKIQKLWENY